MCNYANIYANMIAVTNRKLCERPYLEQIRKIVTLHPYALILREKDLDQKTYFHLAEEVVSLCHAESVPCYIHSFAELLEPLNETHLHLSIPGMRALLKEDPQHLSSITFSVSCHSLTDALEAEKAGAHHILLGNIFETDCKKGLPGKGLDFLKSVCGQVCVPVYGIGGITAGNLDKILDAGAAGGCMMSGFMKL